MKAKNLKANEVMEWIQGYASKLAKPKIKDDYTADMLEIVGVYISHRTVNHSVECRYEFDREPRRERKYEYVDEKAGLKIHIDREIAEDKVVCVVRAPSKSRKVAMILTLDRDVIVVTNEYQTVLGVEENTVSKIRLNGVKDVKVRVEPL